MKKISRVFGKKTPTNQEWLEVKTIEHSDTERCVVISIGSHNFFQFLEYQWLGPWEEDGNFLDDGYWNCTHMSGLYDTLDETEKDARKTITWLKANSD